MKRLSDRSSQSATRSSRAGRTTGRCGSRLPSVRRAGGQNWSRCLVVAGCAAITGITAAPELLLAPGCLVVSASAEIPDCSDSSGPLCLVPRLILSPPTDTATSSRHRRPAPMGRIIGAALNWISRGGLAGLPSSVPALIIVYPRRGGPFISRRLTERRRNASE